MKLLIYFKPKSCAKYIVNLMEYTINGNLNKNKKDFGKKDNGPPKYTGCVFSHLVL